MDRPLPTGVTLLAGDPAASPLHRTLAASAPEADPEREGIRVLLALAWTIAPAASLADFVASAGTLIPQLAGLNPAQVADVATAAGFGTWPTAPSPPRPTPTPGSRVEYSPWMAREPEAEAR